MNNYLMERLKLLSEKSMFGVFTWLGEVMGVASGRIRLFFIYITFLTFGSPIFIYLAFAFVLNLGKYIRSRRRNPIWEY